MFSNNIPDKVVVFILFFVIMNKIKYNIIILLLIYIFIKLMYLKKNRYYFFNFDLYIMSIKINNIRIILIIKPRSDLKLIIST